jgi:ATP-dependent helicase/nuclease subunit A
MLQIVKASAGSGKTFQLVLEYLRLVLTTSVSFRHILAITFTNKATTEMKERILEQLGLFARGEDSKYLVKLMELTGYQEHVLRKNSKYVLENLLFDFNRFSVSTIDTFTQRILKAFNREMRINPNFQLETDTDLLLSESVDRMISKADKNPMLFKWLESFIEDKIRNSKSFTIENDLKKLGADLFKEKLQGRINELSGFLNDKEKSREYFNIIYSIIHQYENQLKEQAKNLVNIYSAEGFTSADFFSKTTGIAGLLEKMAKGISVKDQISRLEKAGDSIDRWVPVKHNRRAELLKLTEDQLLPRFYQFLDYIRSESKNYHTARVIKSEWFTAALMVDLNDEMTELAREKGILPLSSSNLLLKGVIDGSDTPFVYEKAGNIWHHFMLDEFQDTSEMQWDNLKPLINNSLSDDNFSLVVGDVKQSIYRWRNSNWKILDEHIQRDFLNFDVQKTSLLFNFRSGKNIVDFNNSFFNLFSQHLAGHQKLDDVQDYRQKLLDLYGDIYQQCAVTGSPDGFVGIEGIDAEGNDFVEKSLNRLVEQIKEMFDNGFKAGDLAILVRKNDQGALIVQHFMDISQLPENMPYNLRIISGESLLLKSSAAVGFVIYLFRHLTDHNNRLYKACVLHLFKSYIEPFTHTSETTTASGQNLSEWYLEDGFEEQFCSILGEKIISLGNKSITNGVDELIIHICKDFNLFDTPAERPYLQALIDKAFEVKKAGINDIAGFIRWWDEKGDKVPVNINEQVDAIRLFTVHKAKGLEFKAVFIPFMDWNLFDYTKKNILWCKPGVKPFNRAPLVPVNFSDQLADTIFEDDYFHELTSLLIDNLNLVYVAFTRAESVLRVNIPSKNKENNIGKYIENSLHQLSSQSGFENTWNAEQNIFSFGILPHSPAKKPDNNGSTASGWIFTDFSNQLLLRQESDDFFGQTGKGIIRKNKGKILHSILSEIKTAGDVDPACKQALASGMLLPSEWEETRAKIFKMVQHPMAKDWFSGKWKVHTETDLLTDSEIFRPDRMMIGMYEAVVVDYKSGESKPEYHERQVQRYVSILKETGIPEVKGYLWYTQGNELVQV